MAVGALPYLSEIQTEFGMSAGNSFFQLYRGGPYVPDITANAAVGTTPATTYLSQFPNTQDQDPNLLLNWADLTYNGDFDEETIIGSCTLSWTVFTNSGSPVVFPSRNGSNISSGTAVSAGDVIRFSGNGFAGSYNADVSVFSNGIFIDSFNVTGSSGGL
ncbi:MULTISPECIES: hypothetical protein [Pseudomonadota]|uniref:hypothetical protein n=1 Tax=Pseudomonadota TaxID=1224 RepID=UPI00262114CE|nr:MULTISPECIES: hypothetical protein [Pseudomonadota]